jgi:ABC-type phosphate transport system auxiliary subunit
MIVQASSPGALANFRADLGGQFSGEQLQAFDTAVQELKLDAMNRDVAPAAAREQDMCAAVNGKTVRQVEILGWQARKARFEREIAIMSELLEHTLKAKGAQADVRSNQDVLTKLRSQLAETERQLATWTEARG